MSRTVIAKGASGLRQTVIIGSHHFLGYEAKDVGGTDEGPDPYEYLLAALGTCTNMTVRMYANRKRWPLHGVRTALSHAKSHTADCEHCEQPTAMVDRIEIQITFLGELSEEQRNRLLQIADRCPVHRTLTSKIVIHTVLAATALQ